MREVADFCLRQFIANSAELFGPEFVVYYVHNLVHLSEECAEHGTLDGYSAYRYENYLGIIKRYLRSKYLSLEQLHNRDSERNGRLVSDLKIIPEDEIHLSKQHNNWPEEGDLYSCLQTKNFMFSTDHPADSCFQTTYGEIVNLVNIVNSPDGVTLVGHRFTVLENYFQYPVESMVLGICKASRLELRSRRWDLADVAKKCVLMPIDNQSFLSVPLLHV